MNNIFLQETFINTTKAMTILIVIILWNGFGSIWLNITNNISLQIQPKADIKTLVFNNPVSCYICYNFGVSISIHICES